MPVQPHHLEQEGLGLFEKLALPVNAQSQQGRRLHGKMDAVAFPQIIAFAGQVPPFFDESHEMLIFGI